MMIPIYLHFLTAIAMLAPLIVAAAGPADLVIKTPGLVAFWDFQEETTRIDKGPSRFRLREVNGPIGRIEPTEGAPFGKYAVDVKYQQRFELPRAEMGALNIHGKEAQVTVVAWIKRHHAIQHGKPTQANESVAGVWRELDHKRQYCLFLGIQTNAKMAPKKVNERVSGHVSATGGPSPGHPWCYEVALGATPVPFEEWACVGFTYDGKLIRSYYNGQFDALEGFNPYEQPGGIFDAGKEGADFVIGHTDVKRPNANNQLVAVLGGVAVFNRALSDAEMKQLAEPVQGLRPKPIIPHLRKPTAPYVNKVPFTHFITRQGDKLMDGEREFRFIGANMPGLVLPYDWTLYLPERLHLPTPWEQEDGFKTLDQMNLRVVRLWNLPIRDPRDKPAGGGKTWHYVQGPGEFNEESFKVVDNLFALANKYGVRVIFDLTAEAGDYLGGTGTYAAHRGKKRAEFYTDQQIKEDYKATVRYVLTRTNSITGVPYREAKAILAWQFGNEMHSAPTAWLAEMAAYIKSLDTNHLVSETRHRPGLPMVVDANIDLYTRHLYSNYPGVGGGWPDTCRKEMKAVQGQRPFYIGEFGPYIDGKVLTHENVVVQLRDFLDFVVGEEGMSGALIWSMYFHHDRGGFYWHQIMTYPAVWSYHWPGFLSTEAQHEIGIMQAMREAAFKIQGLPVPPVPVPPAPELLPIGDVPLLSWRGSAGASGYDIERAPQTVGPWTLIATNVPDADIAYRPLYSDTAVRAGQTWFYRVIARNASGASKPSNVVGPVRVKQVCLVDELQDFSRVHARSEGLKLNNDYNALYAEYLFRVKGSNNDWLTYQVPSSIEFVKVVAFYAKDVADLTLQVSSDGKSFSELKPERKERQLPSPPGGAAGGQRRIMVEYECRVPAGHPQLKLSWNGPTELDRVEIYH